jgi:hypothetical protein
LRLKLVLIVLQLYRLVIDLKEAHYELTIRALAFVKIHMRNDINPQSELSTAKELTLLFANYQLFEYAARYWISHFRSSSLYEKSTNKLNLPAQFKICFSNATQLALAEGSCLSHQYIACEAEKLQSLSYNIRKALFGSHSASVLQSLILELRLGRHFKNSLTLTEYSYEAWHISGHVCNSSVVEGLAEAFVEYSASIDILEHSEFCTKKVCTFWR